MANKFNNAPTRKNKPPANIEVLRPIILVMVEAKKEATNVARCEEEANKVRSSLSNLQYRLSWIDSSFIFL